MPEVAGEDQRQDDENDEQVAEDLLAQGTHRDKVKGKREKVKGKNQDEPGN